MNFNYKENRGKKRFSCQTKASVLCILMCGEHDCNVNNKKNGDYNEYPSWSHFTDEQ